MALKSDQESHEFSVTFRRCPRPSPGDIAVRRKHYRAIKIKQLLFSLSHIIKVSLAMYETNCLKL